MSLRTIGAALLAALALSGSGCSSEPCGTTEGGAATAAVVDTLDGAVRSGVTTLPAIPGGQQLIIATPYEVTDAWLATNTTLPRQQRQRLIDASNGLEQVLVAVLSRDCVLDYTWLDSRFVVAEPPILLFGPDDNRIGVGIDPGSAGRVILSRPRR